MGNPDNGLDSGGRWLDAVGGLLSTCIPFAYIYCAYGTVELSIIGQYRIYL